MKVLVCDDSLLIRKKLRERLSELGCEVFEAANGKTAVESYQTIKPDLVFMDIVMPEVDGIQAMKEIRAADPRAIVVILTSTGTSEKLRQAIELGAFDFIQKPCQDEQLVRIVERIKR